jgi:hypothetical protein
MWLLKGEEHVKMKSIKQEPKKKAAMNKHTDIEALNKILELNSDQGIDMDNENFWTRPTKIAF